MCGITGWIDNDNKLINKKHVIVKMTNTLSKRGPDDEGYLIKENALLGHKRLIVIDPKGGIQPMTTKAHDNTYTIVYNGELYNTLKVRKELIKKGYKFKSHSDTEVLLKAFIEWREKCLDIINGIYAFAVLNHKDKSLFMARDPLGVKPLFYYYKNNKIIFASEIKALLAHPMIEPILDEKGIMEIFGLGPARSLGSGVFKNIKEIPPGHFLNFNSYGIKLFKYWDVKADYHNENLEDTSTHLRQLLIDSIERQLISDVGVCTFLSGGLDSSIISTIASNKLKMDGKILKTYSIDYKDNNKYFKPNEFQPNSDSKWVKKMVRHIKSDHKNIEIDNYRLIKALKEAVLARDLPGMADIDSSLLLFCSEVKKDATVALSGECADEIFGGYPWFLRKEDLYLDTFPWSRALDERKSILNKKYNKLPIKEYVQRRYSETLIDVPKLGNESFEESKMRELFYLNIKWFMVTLLNRKDRMSMANSLEVRVPFADKRLVQYAYNIPKNMKFLDGREKGLLRSAVKDILPKEIISRKKSPYPKTHNPLYTKLVTDWMEKIINDKNAPIHELIDIKMVKEITKDPKKNLKKPWFGQLMTGPQLIAYLIQTNIWLNEYNVIIR